MNKQDFPILVQLQEDVKIGHMPFREGDQLIFNDPDEVPSGIWFLLLETNCEPKIVQFFEKEEAAPKRLIG